MIYQTPGVCKLGDMRCRVQVRQCVDGSFQQRHVWLTDYRGQPLDRPSYDRWIASYTRKPELALRGMIPAPEERDEIDELVAALREIAAGHNDPRARAREALDRAGIA